MQRNHETDQPKTALDRGETRDRPRDISLEEFEIRFDKTYCSRLRASTRVQYAATFTRLKAHFGPRTCLNRITRETAELFIADQKRIMVKGKGFSAATRNKHLRQCKTIFNVAVEWGYLLTNPFSRIKQQKAAPKAWHYLKPSEFQRILAVVNDLRWRVFYYLVYTTGARVGELFNLTWSDVDLKRGIITIHSRRASEQLPPFQVKDHETRTLPIPIQTIEALKAWRKAASAEIPFVLLTATRWERVCAMWALCRKGEPWHMDGKTGQKVWTEWDSRFMVNNVLRNVRTHVRRAEIRLGAAMTVHSLRKSFAQNHADHGTPSATLKDLMGHASTQWRG